jgi:hypothetical protein
MRPATKGQFYTYCLFASDDPTPKYIGKGTATRKEQHTHKVPKADEKGSSPKSEWIREVLARGATVQSKIIKAFDDEEAAYAYEAQLIEMHADTLTNSASGGSGDRVHKKTRAAADATPGEFKAPEPVFLKECSLKEEAFAQAYIANGGNASDAYRTAWKTAKTTKPESIWTNASGVLNRPHVKHRIQQLHNELKRKTGRTLEGLLDEYDENRKLALSTSQPGAANGATKGKAELLGFAKGDAPNDPSTVNNNLIVMGDGEVARRLAALLQKGVVGA